jgi:hypothetical protein
MTKKRFPNKRPRCELEEDVRYYIQIEIRMLRRLHSRKKHPRHDCASECITLAKGPAPRSVQTCMDARRCEVILYSRAELRWEARGVTEEGSQKAKLRQDETQTKLSMITPGDITQVRPTTISRPDVPQDKTIGKRIAGLCMANTTSAAPGPEALSVPRQALQRSRKSGSVQVP